MSAEAMLSENSPEHMGTHRVGSSCARRWCSPWADPALRWGCTERVSAEGSSPRKAMGSKAAETLQVASLQLRTGYLPEEHMDTDPSEKQQRAQQNLKD